MEIRLDDDYYWGGFGMLLLLHYTTATARGRPTRTSAAHLLARFGTGHVSGRLAIGFGSPADDEARLI